MVKEYTEKEALKKAFDERYDTAFVQERTRENNEFWNGLCSGVNWGRNTIADAPVAEVVEIPSTGIGDLSDGYHTFNELYHHRAVLFAALCNTYSDRAWKSMRHHDGDMYDGMFIVGIKTPAGQATYHYDIDPYWDMFDVKVLERAPEWDGHTPSETLSRILTLTAKEKCNYGFLP